MTESQHSGRPAAVTQAQRNSYLRHVRIHMELLQDSLDGNHSGCEVGQHDRAAIDKLLLDIWNIAWAAELAVADLRRASGGQSRDANSAPDAQGAKVIPFPQRLK